MYVDAVDKSEHDTRVSEGDVESIGIRLVHLRNRRSLKSNNITNRR